MSKIFISHASTDSPTALAVAEWLTANGWDDYFLDVSADRGLAAGERWQEALRRAADRCEAVLFLISPTWRDSQWCLAEFLLAKQLGKAIFGALIEPTPLETLPVEMTAEWQICDLVAGDQRQHFEIHRDNPPIPRTTVSLSAAGLARLKHGLQRAGLDADTFPWPPKSDPERRPYRGLEALDLEDAAIFFGRDAALVRALDRLRRLRQEGVDRLFVILGASGAGKSSFLRAGLLPRLLRDDRHFLPLPVIRPERAAVEGSTGLLASIEGAFARLGIRKNRADIRKKLGQPRGFTALLNDLRTHAHARVIPAEIHHSHEGGDGTQGYQDVIPAYMVRAAMQGKSRM
uniref:TIR domain-containing protein n=1 Tax=Candidatus Kentrum sp. FW TaxID=2126338 RepID=A0A450U4H4_9GAMM|nr:MAG: TIR domain-containing protein [Candidatus Kentron sp. FW]